MGLLHKTCEVNKNAIKFCSIYVIRLIADEATIPELYLLLLFLFSKVRCTVFGKCYLYVETTFRTS